LVVLLSVVIHGGSPMLLARWCREGERDATPPDELREAPVVHETPVVQTAEVAPQGGAIAIGPQSITLEELDRLLASGEKVIILDVRTERSMETSESMAAGAVRVLPDHPVDQIRKLNLPKDAWLIAYCA
jgi:hypothetical protein